MTRLEHIHHTYGFSGSDMPTRRVIDHLLGSIVPASPRPPNRYVAACCNSITQVNDHEEQNKADVSHLRVQRLAPLVSVGT